MKLITAALVSVLLTGCATEKPFGPVIVKVPVPVPCHPPEIIEPVYFSGNGDIYEKVRALLAELELRKGYEIELRAAVEACS